jgi:hypothetical protein
MVKDLKVSLKASEERERKMKERLDNQEKELFKLKRKEKDSDSLLEEMEEGFDSFKRKMKKARGGED